jgi:hypothetical protein
MCSPNGILKASSTRAKSTEQLVINNSQTFTFESLPAKKATMQFQYIYAFVAILPSLAMAGPIENDNGIMKRSVDFCPPLQFVQGDYCNVGSGGSAPHACGKANPGNIVSTPHEACLAPILSLKTTDTPAQLKCVNKKWALDRNCPGGQYCACTSESDIVCRN